MKQNRHLGKTFTVTIASADGSFRNGLEFVGCTYPVWYESNLAVTFKQGGKEHVFVGLAFRIDEEA